MEDHILNSVLEFINNRFQSTNVSNNTWLTTNCYYFSVILKERFMSLKPEIYYDVVNNKFLTLIKNVLFNASGIAYKLSNEELNRLNNTQYWKPVTLDYDKIIVNWQYFHLYDPLQKEQIEKDLIQ